MVSRIKPGKFDLSTIHEKCLENFNKKHWIPIFEKFDGYKENISLEFSYSFDGESATIGNFTSDYLRIFWHKLLDYLNRE